MGSLTYSRLDRAVIARYFAFLIISQLIIFTLIGVIFSELSTVLRDINGLLIDISPDSVKQIVYAINTNNLKEILANLHGEDSLLVKIRVYIC